MASSVICAHSQALAQCQAWLNQHYPNIERHAVASNARGGAYGRRRWRRWRAIAERDRPAQQYEPAAWCKSHIQDDPHNRTRFAVVGRQQTTPIGSRSDFAGAGSAEQGGRGVQPAGAAGQSRNVSMTRFESRPGTHGHVGILLLCRHRRPCARSASAVAQGAGRIETRTRHSSRCSVRILSACKPFCDVIHWIRFNTMSNMDNSALTTSVPSRLTRAANRSPKSRANSASMRRRSSSSLPMKTHSACPNRRRRRSQAAMARDLPLSGRQRFRPESGAVQALRRAGRLDHARQRQQRHPGAVPRTLFVAAGPVRRVCAVSRLPFIRWRRRYCWRACAIVVPAARLRPRSGRDGASDLMPIRKLIFIANPNNPTGTFLEGGRHRSFPGSACRRMSWWCWSRSLYRIPGALSMQYDSAAWVKQPLSRTRSCRAPCPRPMAWLACASVSALRNRRSPTC